MGFAFAETATGTVAWDRSPGITHPFRFELRIAAASTRDFFTEGSATLEGVLHAPPIAEAAPTRGVITLRPVGQRIIRYELAFVGDDGKPYELVGQKDVRWRSPLRTLTHLPADILDEDHRRVGTCDVVTTASLRRR